MYIQYIILYYISKKTGTHVFVFLLFLFR